MYLIEKIKNILSRIIGKFMVKVFKENDVELVVEVEGEEDV